LDFSALFCKPPTKAAHANEDADFGDIKTVRF